MEPKWDFLKDCAMNAIADDYENLDHIVSWTTQLMDQKGFTVSSAEIIGALSEVISEGRAQAYQLSPHPPHVSLAKFSATDADKLWFYLTPAGLEAVKNTAQLGCEPPGNRWKE